MREAADYAGHSLAGPVAPAPLPCGPAYLWVLGCSSGPRYALPRPRIVPHPPQFPMRTAPPAPGPTCQQVTSGHHPHHWWLVTWPTLRAPCGPPGRAVPDYRVWATPGGRGAPAGRWGCGEAPGRVHAERQAEEPPHRPAGHRFLLHAGSFTSAHGADEPGGLSFPGWIIVAGGKGRSDEVRVGW
ncbi:hypothetical protein VULLAG_LOCUS19498 [Vulpes lagopus]